MTHNPHFATTLDYARGHLIPYDSFAADQRDDAEMDLMSDLATAIACGQLAIDPADVRSVIDGWDDVEDGAPDEQINFYCSLAAAYIIDTLFIRDESGNYIKEDADNDD